MFHSYWKIKRHEFLNAAFHLTRHFGSFSREKLYFCFIRTHFFYFISCLFQYFNLKNRFMHIHFIYLFIGNYFESFYSRYNFIINYTDDVIIFYLLVLFLFMKIASNCLNHYSFYNFSEYHSFILNYNRRNYLN